MSDLKESVDRIKALAATFDGEADRWRLSKKEAELREIWFMNRASALREAAQKVERIAHDYAQQSEET
ncbi:hypothetical protein [Streptomyces turgidiscabies]|uniref:hypothetical protein n=1 Tax=Streptomyces turgidiscabies TaxID=85558 RepID=UPI0038F73D8D